MRPETIQQFNTLKRNMARTYNVRNVAHKFNVAPSIEQKLNDAIVATNPMLQKINVVPVNEIQGEKVFLGVASAVTGRTNTKKQDRVPRNLVDLDNDGYQLYKTDSDVCISYEQMDVWAKFKDFASRYSRAVQHRMGVDRIMVGWYGTSVATQTDLVANPQLQDVNKGWLQIIREKAPTQILKKDEQGTQPIVLGDDYANLDELATDLKFMIGEPFKADPDLVFLVGSDLIARHHLRLYHAQGETPSEKEKVENQQVIKTFGGLPSFSFPGMPSRLAMVTSFNNLSLYFQSSSWRKQVIDNPRRDQVEDYNSRNEGYVVEQYQKIAFVEPDQLKFKEELTN
ncbi:phage major capsid protein, P2 family [Zooshikella ganghwensis]|uniref:Phage major capsid protein, P2 family n=1 Tax=Zooshikella ganghwensis TaxID=202772 RepID=A0A4P9VDQ8_9GAMM|nr:phage major capsid protein, P2 family [Zooshikella ganghwensis]RDH41205.1 phage major capsid protein, P2 family [Zooshikella ganghwensis]